MAQGGSPHRDLEAGRGPPQYRPPRDRCGILDKGWGPFQIKQGTCALLDGEASQGRPEAVVRTGSEREQTRRTRVGESGRIEAVGMLPNRRFAVSSRGAKKDHRTGGKFLSGDSEWRNHGSRHRRDAGLEPDGLGHCAGHEVGPGPEMVSLLAFSQQGEESATDLAGCGVVATDEQVRHH